MTTRNKGLADQQTLVWNAENHLSEVQDSAGDMIERYWYDIGGSRVKKVSGSTTTYTLFGHYEEEVSGGSTTTYTFFGHYEEEVSGGSTTEIRHYSFGSLRIAVKRGSTLYHLHGDHLGSTSLTTLSSTSVASRAYYAYGAERSASGDLKTDRTFTGQKSDASGLLYYNARYYDPTLGTFISPDSLVPNPARVVDYNRFLYARGNPLKYSDPSGHASAESIREWKAKNSWYNARGWAWGGSHWNIKTKASFASIDAVIDVLKGAGIEVIEQGWKQWELELLLEGIEAFGKRIEKISNRRQVNGFVHLKGLIDGTVEWHRMAKGSSGFCAIGAPAACAWNKGVEFYDALFNGTDHDYIRGMAVHEMAHKIHFDLPSNCGVVVEPRCDITYKSKEFLKQGYGFTDYAAGPTWWVDYWAEAVGVWVFRNDYPGLLVDAKTELYMIEIFDWVEGIIEP